MKLIGFAIFDLKSRTYVEPFFAPAEAPVIRSLTDLFGNPKASESPYVRFPNDFELHKLGTFDNETGKLKAGVEVGANDVVAKFSDFAAKS